MILKTSLRAASLLVVAVSLSACFQPVHGTRLGNSTVSGELSRISVAPINGGYLEYSLKSELDFLLGNGAIAQNPRYVLTVRAAYSRSSSIIDVAASRLSERGDPGRGNLRVEGGRDWPYPRFGENLWYGQL